MNRSCNKLSDAFYAPKTVKLGFDINGGYMVFATVEAEGERRNVLINAVMEEVIITLIEAEKIVLAIKLVRCEYGIGLKSAKEIIDIYRDEMRQVARERAERVPVGQPTMTLGELLKQKLAAA